jgi:hypothetical protein
MPRFLPIEERFKGRHFDREIVMLCVRWYLSYRLSYRDLVAIIGECGMGVGMGVAPTTILRWVPHDSPELERGWNRYARSVGGNLASRRGRVIALSINHEPIRRPTPHSGFCTRAF